jgi:hypothetical protein
MKNVKMPSKTYSLTIKDAPLEQVNKKENEYEHINSTIDKSPRRKYTGYNLTNIYLELLSEM